MRHSYALILGLSIVLAPVESISAQAGGPERPGSGSATRSTGESGSKSIGVRALEGRIAIDGRLDEAAWATAEVASDFVQRTPNPGEPSGMRTEARILLGDDAIYVGVRLFDSAPDSIVAQLARRGVENVSDRVAVAFDSHYDRRTAFQFEVNAAGVKRDVRIADEIRMDDSWEGIWDVAVSRDEDGWTAEFMIPLSQLRFEAGDHEQTWGFNVGRVVARTGETSFWSPTLPNTGAYVSYFGTLTGMRIARSPRRVELFPYLTSRIIRAPGDASSPYFRATDLNGGAGLDLRTGLTSWLTLNATINPDFGQIEADPSVVNLSAFEVVLPERRPFFIEGAEYFNTPGSDLFYSRRIGRSPQLRTPSGAIHSNRPDRTTILGSAKVTGRSPGGWSVGIFSAFTAEEHARYTTASGEESAPVEPMTSYSVVRLGRDFRNGRSGIGLIGTSTNRFLDDTPGMDGLRRDALSGGVDARHRFRNNQFEISGTLYLSHVRGDSAAILNTQRAPGRYLQRPDADHLMLRPELRTLSGESSSLRIAKVAGGSWRGGIALSSVSPGFEVNDLGRHFTVDQLQQRSWVSYSDFDPNGLLRRWSVRAEQVGMWTHGGERLDFNGTLDLSTEFQNQWNFGAWGMRHAGGIDPDQLRGGPAYFSPGVWMGRLSVGTDPRRPLSANTHFYADARDADEGRAWALNSTLLWRPSARADLQLSPFINRRSSASQFVHARSVPGSASPRYILSEIDQFTAALGIRLNYAVSPNLSLEFHARPFVATGEYDNFRAVVPEAAREADRSLRLKSYTAAQLQVVDSPDGRRLVEIDENTDGTVDIRFAHPDFNRKDLRSTAVLRWEFSPGSTFFLVWSHDRSRSDALGGFDPILDAGRLWRAHGRNIIAVKASYRLGF